MLSAPPLPSPRTLGFHPRTRARVVWEYLDNASWKKRDVQDDTVVVVGQADQRFLPESNLHHWHRVFSKADEEPT